MKNLDVNQVKNVLENSLFVLEQYKWLIDSYVLDFFVENHWKQLPKSWQDSFAAENFHVEEMAYLLNYEEDSPEKLSSVLPLSLLSLRKVIHELSIKRKQENVCYPQGALLALLRY